MAAARDVGPARRFRVLIVHNRYRQRGGEDAVVDAESELLRRHGHVVHAYERHNDELAGLSRGRVLLDSLWSARSRRELQALAVSFRPDLVHVHNSFPLISPSVHAAARELGLPVVQSLHNFRLLCPQGTLLRDGRPCDDCVGRAPWPAVRHRCYHDSRPHSAGVALMLQLHRLRGTWQRDVTLHLALNRFCADTLVRGGLPRDRIRLKPNFADLPPPPPGQRQGLLFVGRLSPEKGTALLAAAAARRPSGPPIRVIGDGPDRARLAGRPGLQLLGELPPAAVTQAMQRAAALLLPSLAAEAFPRALVEAFACGLPVIASRAGALPELVRHGDTGLLFEAGDEHALVSAMQWAEDHPQAMQAMGAAARAHQQQHWTGDQVHRRLCEVYEEALTLRSGAAR
jgi:glycosyltransferase involved in cell wall biosynthesis